MIALSKGEHKKPDFLKVNPNGALPAFEDNSVTLYESTAMVYYLLDKYDLNDKLGGKRGSKERANLYKLTQWITAQADDIIVGYILNKMFLPDPMKNPKLVEENGKKFEEKLAAIFELELGDKQYFNGSEFSAVDVVVGYTLSIASKGGLLAKHPKLEAYCGRITSRPHFVKANTEPK